MKRMLKKVVAWFKIVIKAIAPGENAFKGASKVLFLVLLLLLLTSAIILAINVNDPWIFAFYIIFSGLIFLMALGINWVLKLIIKIPKRFRFVLIASFFILTTLFRGDLPYIIIVVSSVLGASIYSLFKTKFKNLTIVQKIISLLGFGVAAALVVIGIIQYSVTGIKVKPLINAAFTSDKVVEHIPLESPATTGIYKVKTLFYGSGKDKHRDQFGENVDIKTDSIDGVAFLDNWKGMSGWWRTNYWGFDLRSLPLNARVWYPEGEGPFPLVLIVHGNHSMQDYSDVGYGYLGELLASRGMIVASVDENFLNYAWSDEFSDGLNGENDARGWVLLEHLRQWHEWNEDVESPFFQKVDTDNLSLIGHSRGGEAVGHAALMNTLPYYSDDASIKLDYNFNIKSIIAIAPVDGQYQPGGTRTKLKNINYFVIHGAQDADVNSYAGNNQFDRISFTDDVYRFKAGLYVYGANHGQFNTSWGDNDAGIAFKKLLNLKQLMSGEDQREIAKVYISAFLETTLRGQKEYLPLFTDVRAGKKWLPETIYLSQFEDSNSDFFATFEEDFDVTTMTKDSIEASSSNLTVWKEKRIPMKWNSKTSRGLFLGWHYKNEDKETRKKDSISEEDKRHMPVHDSLIANYTINFQSNLANIDSTSVFVFSLAESTMGSNPKAGGKWIIKKKEIKKNVDKSNKNKGEEAVDNQGEKNKLKESDKEDIEESQKEEEKRKEKKDHEPKGKEPIDFSILLKDANGSEVYFPLSNFSKLQRRLGVKLMKMDFRKGEKSENVLQFFSFPIKDMLVINPDFDPARITQIKFIFDRTDKGVVLIDNIGFMKDLSTIDY